MKQRDIGIGIVTEEGKILICQRKPDVPLGGYWEFPGGKVEPPETPADCVAREILEETGLTVRPTEPLAIIEHQYPDVHVRLHPYLCARVSGQARAIDCQKVRWIHPLELQAYAFPPANQTLIQSLLTRFAAIPPGRR